MSDIPTSGMISINQMHTEAGGNSGTACTLNDADIRGLINKSSGAAMNFGEWYGASAEVDSQTVTVGNLSFVLYGTMFNNHGFTSGSMGAISDGTCNFKSGATITDLSYDDLNGNTAKAVVFKLSGTHANSGFTTMSLAGTNYARTSATFSTVSNVTSWVWTTTTNPFGTTAGATKVVTFS